LNKNIVTNGSAAAMLNKIPIQRVLCDCKALESENAERVNTSPLATVNIAIGRQSVRAISAAASNK
jgi:hypothetical protein